MQSLVHMKNLISLFVVIISLTFSFIVNAGVSSLEIYHKLGLNNHLNYIEFAKVYDAFRMQNETDIMKVTDYTKPETQDRTYVIDMKNQKVLSGPTKPKKKIDSSIELHHKLGLEGKLDVMVFRKAYDSFRIHSKTDFLTVIDYTKPSSEKRFWVFDLKNARIVHHTWVAHGKNSGTRFAKNFSNIKESKQTSLGVFTTAETYYGKHGLSLRLDGLTLGKNDNARKRYIVVHGAKYASKSFIDTYGIAGTSWGCPALPNELAKNVIDTIKGGSVIYAYG